MCHFSDEPFLGILNSHRKNSQSSSVAAPRKSRIFIHIELMPIQRILDEFSLARSSNHSSKPTVSELVYSYTPIC